MWFAQTEILKIYTEGYVAKNVIKIMFAYLDVVILLGGWLHVVTLARKIEMI